MPNLSTFLHEVGAKGYQKTNWFEFRMATLPGGMAASDISLNTGDFVKHLRDGFVCTSVSLPGRQFSTTPQTIYGFERNIPNKGMYNPLQCTFLTPHSPDGHNVVVEFFQRWQNAIQDTTQDWNPEAVSVGEGAFDLQFPNHIYGEAEIVQYSFIDLARGVWNRNTSGDGTVEGSLHHGHRVFRRDEALRHGGETNRQISLRHRYTELYPVTIGETRLDWGASSEFTTLDVTFNYSYWVDMGKSVDFHDNVFGVPQDQSVHYQADAKSKAIEALTGWHSTDQWTAANRPVLASRQIGQGSHWLNNIPGQAGLFPPPPRRKWWQIF